MNATSESPRLDPSTEVARYAAVVRAALGDVRRAQRDELLDDLVEHLREVAAEGEVPLQERLGTPQAYAQELRASLGLPETVGSAARPTFAEQVNALYERAVRTRLGTELRDYVPTLQPAWWLVRAWLVTLILAAMSGFRPYGGFSVVVPRIGESRLLGFVVLVLAAAASVHAGRRPPRVRSEVMTGANAVIAVVGLLTALTMIGRPSNSYEQVSTIAPPPENAQGQPVVVDRSGNAVSNLQVRGADGTPLEGVQIFTQNGTPLDNLAEPVAADGATYVPQQVRDAAGNVVTNSFPRRFDVIDPSTGSASPTPAPTGLAPTGLAPTGLAPTGLAPTGLAATGPEPTATQPSAAPTTAPTVPGSAVVPRSTAKPTPTRISPTSSATPRPKPTR